jgi:hypothetical protein
MFCLSYYIFSDFNVLSWSGTSCILWKITCYLISLKYE